jgi:hypothetical protein
MTERGRPRRPPAAAVIWASTLLFAALFALLTYNLSLAGPPAQGTAPTALVRKVIKRRVVTTVVPTPGENTVSSSPPSYAASESAPITTSAS